jgi:hypothetical protein
MTMSGPHTGIHRALGFGLGYNHEHVLMPTMFRAGGFTGNGVSDQRGGDVVQRVMFYVL